VATKSSTPAQVISLPQGGGALHGIGEKFSPDLHTGTGNFTIPIALPPGRNGFNPQLNLGYSTGNGNGHYGLGWGISVPNISRKTSQGVPRYDSERDTFILAGAEDLVAVQQGQGVTRYRPRTEGLFARIEHHQTEINDYWQVWSKDGLVSFYGTQRPDGAELDWQDPAVVADPDNRTRIFCWRLALTVDPFGNRIEYEYDRELGNDGPHRWDELYLRRIRYVDYSEGEQTRFLVSATFDYEDRPDPYSEYRVGFEIRVRRRCQRIAISTHAVADHLVRTYHLVYLDQRTDLDNLENLLPLNRASLLHQVRVVGHDGDRTEELPPLEFGYTQFEPRRRDFIRLEGRDLPAASLASADFELIDIIGNGLPDFFEMNGTVRYWRNLGGGRFDLQREMRTAPAGLSLADAGVQLIDANGDGRIDLLVTKEGIAGYYPMRFGGLWDRRAFQRYRVAPGFNLEDPEVRLVDLDGDGVTDAIRAGTRLECFFNDPIEGWNETRHVERRALEVFPNVNFSDPRVKWGDLSGDGLQDIALVYDGNVEYWPNLGYGNWGRRISMHNSPRFPFGYDPKQILIGDVDGDGLADLIYVDHSNVTVWINQGGNGWSDPITIQGTPPLTNLGAVRLVDLLGTGVSGVLWSTGSGGQSRHQLFFLDFTGGVKPYVLTEMNNHRGAITRVNYRSSTEEYLRDQAHPETRWRTPLPFPVQVVSKVVVIDEFSRGRLTSDYRYHHGYWDGGEREYRGFGYVETLNTETFEDYFDPSNNNGSFAPVEPLQYSPPTLTRSWFHLGPVGDEFGEWEAVDHNDEYWSGDVPTFAGERQELQEFLAGLDERRERRDALRALSGTLLRTELYAIDGGPLEDRPYTVTESIYGLREVDPPADEIDSRRRIFFPHMRGQRTTQWDRGDDPLTQIGYTTAYDEYGQPRLQLQVACPRGWRDFANDARPGSDYLAVYTETRFAQRDDDLYMVDRAAGASSFQIYPPQDQAGPAVTVTQLRDRALDDSAPRELISQSFNYYDDEAFVGLPLGELGEFGALVRSETLVTTETILAEADRGDDPTAPPAIPPYLDSGGEINWPDEYPEPFRQGMQPLAGYRFVPGDTDHSRGYFVDSIRNRYDFQTPGVVNPRGLLLAARDPLERETTIIFDRFDLLPERVTDAVGLATTTRNDYRVLQPDLVSEHNGNRTAVMFTPLGLPGALAVIGKEEEPGAGDTPETPGTRFEYGLLAYDDSPADNRQPVFIRTIRRVHHVNDTDIPIAERDNTIESVEYSDGFGRLLQTRAQAEDVWFGTAVFGNDVLPPDQNDSLATGAQVTAVARNPDDPPTVVVSGWQNYDNKGQVVEKYEPFFDTGWNYLSLADARRQRDEGIRSLFGQRVMQFYDPRGHVVRMVNPEGSQQRVIYGVPSDISNPDTFSPTPWESYTYDANDLAPLSEGPGADDNPVPLTGLAPVAHHFTPSSIEIDALGRTIRRIQRNGAGSQDEIETRSRYDIRGNLLAVIDALDRNAFGYTYDLANQTVRVISIDAGIKRTVLDAVGNLIEQRDSKGALILTSFDNLNRPINIWARDDDVQRATLRQHLVYGDQASAIGIDQMEARRRNALGRLVSHYDEAGRVLASEYDFKGNLLEKTRQVISDEEVLSVFDGAADNNWQVSAYQVDWQPPAMTIETRAAVILAPTEYTMSFRFDALNRTREVIYPRDVDNERKILRPRYNRAGALDSITFDGDSYVERVAYNAKGQRTLVAYGNGIITRYAYEPLTFRLSRLRSERFSQPSDSSYQPIGLPLQDIAYEYDLADNITAIRDRTPESGIPNTLSGPEALDRRFTYDAIYRLLSATGRECDIRPELPPWLDDPRCTDLTRTRGYTERYQYDSVGNMLSLQHQNATGGFTREFALAVETNRLETLTIGPTGFAYTYDARGNLTGETTSRHFEWGYSDRMKVYRTQTDGAEPSIHAHYLYDSEGQRVKKLVRRQGGGVETTTYVDEIFEHHRRIGLSGITQNNTLQVTDGRQRAALVRVGEPSPDDSEPPVRFQLNDHLGSSHLVVDDAGSPINREEFTPFGETSFGGYARKRYRFSGKERDEESRLCYHKSRYYVPWLARWSIPDGLRSRFPDWSAYVYAFDKPLTLTDSSGLAPAPPGEDLSGVSLRGLETRLSAAKQATADLVSKTGAIAHEFDKAVAGVKSIFEKLLGSSVVEKLVPQKFQLEAQLNVHNSNVEAIEAIEEELTRRSSFSTHGRPEDLLMDEVKLAKEEALKAKDASKELLKQVRKEIRLRLSGPGPKGGGGGSLPPAPTTPTGARSFSSSFMKSFKEYAGRAGGTVKKSGGVIGLAIAAGMITYEVWDVPEAEKPRAIAGAIGEQVGGTGGTVLEGGILAITGPVGFAAARYFDVSGRVGNTGREVFKKAYDLGSWAINWATE
jgi:RHS repeat-associated protein